MTQPCIADKCYPLFDTLVIPPAEFLLRQEARERYGIEGSTAGDALASFCCGPCVDCQTAAEIKGRGDAN